ncbi:hypothetical protein ALP59_200051 [Pseudomonas savastanoi]|uniref:Uncharacterized protein n=1 Tax=Pseudomonas savastanoi TaxID=29438 RepID=A0A3M5GEL9_PSESS|nr:hypothetical protein ALP59_200051 [Pseudomonas savastanoi]
MSPAAEFKTSRGGSRLMTKNHQARGCGGGIFESQGSAS